MANVRKLEPFDDHDRFLRRVARKRDLKGGILHWRVFRTRGLTLSLTFQNAVLQTQPGLHDYQLYFRFESGDLPGICSLSCFALTTLLVPPLEPRHDPDDDPKYGSLHCSTDPPRDEDQMQALQKIVNDGEHGAVLCDFVPMAR